MPNSLSSTGLSTATYTELLSELTAALQAIYGPNINLASDTPDGQWLNIIIQAILDQNDQLLQIYNSFDPDLAIGNILDQRCAINGVVRQAATFTTTNISITVGANYTINLYGLDQAVQPVYTVADTAGNQWQLITTQLSVTAGVHVLLFQASTPGKVLTTPNTITIPVSIVLGVTAINNPTTYATLGLDEESDASLRIRRQQSVALRSQGYFQGLLGALENINGINSAFVYENVTSGTDAHNIPAHSIWVIVSGTPAVALSPAYNALTTYSYGQLASSANVNYISVANNNTGNLVSNPAFWEIYNPIAQTIYAYRNAGCGMFGAQNYTVTQIDGSFFTVYWDNVSPQNLFIKFTASSLNGVNPPNISAIKTFLTANFVPAVGGEVNINAMATLVQEADSNTLVTGDGFSLTSGGSYTSTLNPTALNNQLVVSNTNIIILPMILTCNNVTYTFNGSNQVSHTNVNIAAGGSTIQFSTLGGFGSLTYAVTAGAGSINSSTGLYTSASAGVDTVQVTDGLSNTTTCLVTVA